MLTKDVTILVWDEAEHFHNPQTQRDFGKGKISKAVNNFYNLDEFRKLLSSLDENEWIVICCHVKFKDLSGYQEFINSEISDLYNKPGIIYLSSGSSGDVMKSIRKRFGNSESVILYNELIKGIKYNEIKPITKRMLLGQNTLVSTDVLHTEVKLSHYSQIDYAIITALYNDEFEAVKNFIDFPADEIIATAKKEYHIGYLKTNRAIKVVAAIPSATGMVDSAIIGTQMLELFKPKYLLMSGVCAGIEDLKFGDIIVAKQLFTFQKGKISDIHIKTRRSGQQQKIDLYDRNGKIVDYGHLYDKTGNQISISIERFQVEQDTIIEMNSLVKDKIERSKMLFETKVNEMIASHNKKVSIHLEPMACSTMVINKEGYFEDRIKVINRKTVAVEMESYGVARACQFANDGKTKAIIFKAVMDHGSNKTDAEKKFAAHTSAAFLHCLLESDVLK